MQYQDGQWVDDSQSGQGQTAPPVFTPSSQQQQFTNTSPNAKAPWNVPGNGPVVANAGSPFALTLAQLQAMEAAGGVAPGSPNWKILHPDAAPAAPPPVGPPPPGGANPFSGPIAPFNPSQVGGSTYPTFTPPPLPSTLQSPFALPSAQDLLKNDPGYMARYQLGQDAIQRSAAGQGTLLNGGTLTALNRNAQDYASNEYQNYVQQKLGERQQQASDYLGLAYGPAWQQNQAAVNQYGQLYKQYQDLIGNNRNAQNDYVNALLEQERIGSGAAGAGGSAPPSGSV